MHSIRRYGHFFIVAILIAANALIWRGVSTSAEAPLVTVAFLDIGQGDSVYIEAPNGNQLLIDGGEGGAVLSELAEVMPLGDRSLDIVIGTHPDKDHIGGLLDVVRSYDVGEFLEPGVSADTLIYRELKKAIQEKGIPVTLARRGMTLLLDEAYGVRLDILFPDRDVSDFEANDASIVARLSYASTSVMLTGDAPIKTERYLVSLDGAELPSDILKAGHHGSRTSTSAEFLAAVAPRYAIISSGKNNRYGHPHQEVMALLQTFGIETLRTDEEGTIVFLSDGFSFVRE
ncbi:MBL fold metallo-hydrolase [Candidatus Parcubacteria bacterium]|nr:MBL fold metallo-hydrolase [Candidatus Parcubacteria bacterium]